MKNKLFFLLIFLLAFLLRFWQLGINPPSLDWDEASLGYNAYSLLKTGKDEYGNVWPVSIRSFGDYKPPLYTYLTMVPVYVFGLNEFATRFISALLGSLTVVLSYFLIKEILPEKKEAFYLLFTFLFALSPWHLQFSRVAFEANTALFFYILGLFFFLKGLKKGFYLLFSFLSFGLSIYAYHSPRLLVPVLILGLLLIYFKEVKKHLTWFFISCIVFLFMLLPVVRQLSSATGARFGSVTVINQLEQLTPSIKAMEFDTSREDVLGRLMHNRRIVYAREILAGYLDHFNFDFLFLTGDAPGRHHAAGMGMLYLWDLPFVLLGIFLLLENFNKRYGVILWWFLVAPVASALTKGTPHAVRAIYFLPIYQIFTVLGVFYLYRWLKNRLNQKSARLVLLILFFGLFLNFTYYLHMYYLHTPREESYSWQYGYKEAVQEVAKTEDKYDKIIVTYRYDQPYIFFLFYQKIDPSWYQRNWGSGEVQRAERKFGKFEFRPINWEEDSKHTNVLMVGAESEIPVKTADLIKEIYFLDGKIAFRIFGK